MSSTAMPTVSSGRRIAGRSTHLRKRPMRSGTCRSCPERSFHENWKRQSFLIKKNSAEAKPPTKSGPVSKKGMPSAPQFSRRWRFHEFLVVAPDGFRPETQIGKAR
jgi:hypothetical protein